MSPPRRRAAQADQARGLGGDAVGGHELLLLVHRVEEAERVYAEADNAQRDQREQAERRALCRAQALSLRRRGEHQEWQHQTRGQLHAHAESQRARAGSQTGSRGGAQRERKREQRHHQRVVVRAADRQHEQHGVQPHEARRPASAAPEATDGACDQCHRGQTGERGQCLERPQSARE